MIGHKDVVSALRCDGGDEWENAGWMSIGPGCEGIIAAWELWKSRRKGEQAQLWLGLEEWGVKETKLGGCSSIFLMQQNSWLTTHRVGRRAVPGAGTHRCSNLLL